MINITYAEVLDLLLVVMLIIFVIHIKHSSLFMLFNTCII